MVRSFLVCLFVLALGSCVERSRALTASEREQLRPYITRTAPRPQHRVRAKLGDEVELIGYDLSVDTWTKGGKLVVTWYWHALTDIDDGYALFTHLAPPNGRNHAGADHEGIVRRLYPPGRWNAGEYVRDVQELTLPVDFPGNTAVLFVGVWSESDGRLPVRFGPTDGENRLRAASIRVADVPPPAEPDYPTLRVPRASGPITLDGKLDEPAWRAARLTAPFVRTMNGAPSDFGATVRALWDDTHVYIAFDVADSYLESRFTTHDDHLWEKDCVEIMLDPDGDGRNYFEMQVSPMGVVFDTRYDTRRVPEPFGYIEWQSALRNGVVRRGEPNDDEDGDGGYIVEIALPFASFAGGMRTMPHPAPGEPWRVNFYVMDTQPNGQRANGWSPPLVGDFHVPARFGRLIFEAPE